MEAESKYFSKKTKTKQTLPKMQNKGSKTLQKNEIQKRPEEYGNS